MPNEKKLHTKYLSTILVVIIFIVTFFMLRPFLISILSAIVLTYIFYPVYRRINKVIKNKNIASFLVVLLIFLLFLVPLGFIANALIKETINVYGTAINYLSKDIFNADSLYNSIYTYVFEKFGFDLDIKAVLTNISTFFIEQLQNFIVSLPNKILNFFIVVVVMYYLFKDGELVAERVKSFLPFKRVYKGELIKELEDMTHAVVYGHIVTALAQGAIGALGFFIFGVKGALVWGLVMFFFSLMPIIGPPLVWAPASLYILTSGIITHSPNMIGRGIGLFLYGLLIISTVDNIVRPKVIGTRAKINPAIILLGVVGGLFLFGAIGLIIGPIILSLFFTTLKIYEERK